MIPWIDPEDNNVFFKTEKYKKNILLLYLFLIEDAVQTFAKLFKWEP